MTSDDDRPADPSATPSQTPKPVRLAGGNAQTQVQALFTALLEDAPPSTVTAQQVVRVAAIEESNALRRRTARVHRIKAGLTVAAVVAAFGIGVGFLARSGGSSSSSSGSTSSSSSSSSEQDSAAGPAGNAAPEAATAAGTSSAASSAVSSASESSSSSSASSSAAAGSPSSGRAATSAGGSAGDRASRPSATSGSAGGAAGTPATPGGCGVSPAVLAAIARVLPTGTSSQVRAGTPCRPGASAGVTFGARTAGGPVITVAIGGEVRASCAGSCVPVPGNPSAFLSPCAGCRQVVLDAAGRAITVTATGAALPSTADLLRIARAAAG